MTEVISASHACAHDPDPGCVLCGGTGVRHQQTKGRSGYGVARNVCPCTILGPLQTATTRPLSELPPIKDTAVLDAYPDCQPRTPIDPVARILSTGLQRGNADLMPSMRKDMPTTRECTRCHGKGTLPRSPWAKESGDLMCSPCQGAGRVKL